MKKFLILALLPIALILSACSLAADVTPPPGYQKPVVQETQAPAELGTLYPLVAPNPADGAALFAEKCAPCHGPQGLGGGELAANLPFPPPPVGSPELARQAVPAEWYRIVTQGNLEKRMPPFQSLSDQQRWNVVAYTFSLSQPADMVQSGAMLYGPLCASCHGNTGQGDGPEAASLSTPPTDFTNQEKMAALSAEYLVAAIRQGKGEMPAFSQISEDESWALAAYLRTLSFNPAGGTVAAAQATPEPGSTPQSTVEGGLAPAVTEPAEPAGTPEGTPVAEGGANGLIAGAITNRSGGDVPEGLEVQLHGLDPQENLITRTTTTDAQGFFQFDDVAMPEGSMFLAMVDYNGFTFQSEVATPQPGSASLELPMDIYDTTSELSPLVVNRLHMFFEMPAADVMQIVQLYTISNTSTKMVVPAEDGSALINFKLPAGATNLQFRDGQLGDGRYMPSEEGFSYQAAIVPGENSHQILFAYELPYDKKLELEQTLPLQAQAVVVLAPEERFKVKADQMEDAGTRPADGLNYHQYNLPGAQAGETIRMTVTGRPDSAGAEVAGTSSTSLVVGLAGLGSVLLVAGVWLYRRNQREQEGELEEELVDTAPPVVSDSPETVMDAILTLDDLYKAGEIPDEAYQQRRAELKAQLKSMLDNGS